MAPNNPMARFAVPQRNPLDDVMRMKRREGVRRAAQDTPKRLNEIVRAALSAKLGFGGSPEMDAPRPQTERGLIYGGMSRPPVSEREVMLRDRREKMRGAFLERLRQDRGERSDQYEAAEAEYGQQAGRRGRFLKKAYDVVGTPEGYSDFDLTLMRSQGMVNPLLDEYNEVTRQRAAKEFQRTHKWARKKENLADLDIAVKYLMSRPNFEQSFYYNP